MSKQLSDTAIKNVLPLAIGAVLIIGVLYYLGSKTIKDVAKGVGGVLTGNNVITNNQTNADGTKTTAYVDKGVLGTLGASANSVSGGTLASLGETIGGKLYDWFGGGSSSAASTTYIVVFPDGSKHAVDSSSIAANGYFSYSGVKYRFGKDGSTYIATRVQ